MKDKTRSLLFRSETPRDLFSVSVSVPVYDIEKLAITGDEVTFHIPFDASEKKWVTAAAEKAERALFQRLYEEGYVLWVPEYKGERFSLLAEKEGKRFLILFVLDSESERKVWKLMENSSRYIPIVIRDREEKSTLVHEVSLDSALDSFNFLSL